jgi:hypothetical protein
LFVAFCLQAGQPSLPGALAAEADVAAAWTVVQDRAADRETRLSQADVVAAALATRPPEEQAAFIIDLLGSEAWPRPLDPQVAALEQAWDKFGDRLVEDLVLPYPERAMRVRGAVRALGMLQRPAPAQVEALAQVLGRGALATEARAALARLTGREFGGRSEFDAWWESARTQDRASWLEASLRATQARELADWRAKLDPPAGATPAPAVVVSGMQHPRASVRSLAYRALVGLDPAGFDEPQAAAVTAALRDAVQQESVAELRLELVPLVPRFLRNGEALNSLLRSLEFGSGEEQLAAATNLQLVRPPRAAWNGLLRGLANLYPAPADEGQPVGAVLPAQAALASTTAQVRTALWTGLLAVGRQQGVQEGLDTTEVKALLGRALVVEEVGAVRDRLFQAIGVYGDASFLPVLQPLVARPVANGGNGEVPTRQVPPAERRAALAAMTAVAARGEDPGLVVSLLPDLLADPDVLVRDQAISSVMELKMADGQPLLAARLAREAEAPVRRHLLESLGQERQVGVLEPLLAFEPPQALRALYARAVGVQVNGDFGALNQAYTTLSGRLDWQSTFSLVRGFPADGLEGEDSLALDRLYAQAESEQLLEVGVEKEYQSYAEEAVGLLRMLMGRESADLRWPVYFVELQLMRGEVTEALTVMRSLVPNAQMPLARRWELGLDTLRFAAAQELWDDGRTLLAELDALGPVPEEMVYRADQVRQMFPPPPQPVDEGPVEAGAPGGGEGVGATPPEGGNPDPAPETPAEEPATEDPAPETPPGPEEPATEDPAEQPDGSGARA